MFPLTSKPRERNRQQSQFLEQSSNPVHNLLTLLLDLAVSENFQAIALGYRDPIAEAEFASDAAFEKLLDSVFTDAERDLLKKNARLTGPHGTKTIPVWFKKDAHLFLGQFMPTHVYCNFLQFVEQRLLSIGGTQDQPQPLRYIEITPTPAARHFAEIDLELDATNVFWIHLRNHRTLEPGELVSSHYF